MGNVIYLNNARGIDMSISVFDVANIFLSFESMTHKKLQKLCYYAQAWYLTLNNRRLFNQDIEAWVHGPVVPELYQEYKTYGSRKIPQRNNNDVNNITDFLNIIYNTYGHLSANQLENMTHTEAPWINARIGLNDWEPGYNEISDKDMINYYSNLN